jgi:hypothetical protein
MSILLLISTSLEAYILAVTALPVRVKLWMPEEAKI